MIHAFCMYIIDQVAFEEACTVLGHRFKLKNMTSNVVPRNAYMSRYLPLFVACKKQISFSPIALLYHFRFIKTFIVKKGFSCKDLGIGLAFFFNKCLLQRFRHVFIVIKHHL